MPAASPDAHARVLPADDPMVRERAGLVARIADGIRVRGSHLRDRSALLGCR